MQIISLELENVKSYEHARFEFTPGVNAIVGHNGAGKSTIIEAIGYALFDALPYTTVEFVREGVRTGSVAVTFLSDYDERPYRVERRFGGSNAYTVYDDELKGKVCEGKVDVLAFMHRHTLADPSVDLARLFNDALGVAQGSLTTAFAETPARRKPIFDTLLQVDDYSTASDRLREPSRRLREQLVELDRDLAILATRLEQLPVLEDAVVRRLQELAEAGAALGRLEETLKENQQRLHLLDAQKRAVDTLAMQVARQEELVRSLEAQHRRVAQAKAEAEEAAATIAASQEGYDAYVSAQAEQESLQKRVQQRQQLLNKRASVDKELALAAARCAQFEQAIQEIVAAEATVRELADAVRRQVELEEAVAALERAQGRLAEYDDQIAGIQTRRQKLSERHTAVVAGRARARTVEARGQEINRLLTELRADVDSVREQVAQVNAESSAVENQNEQLRAADTAQCPVCEQPLLPEHRTELLTRNGARLVELRRRQADLQAQADANQQSIGALDQERTRLQQEWTKLPREIELEDTIQTLSDIDREEARVAEERHLLAEQVVGLTGLRQTLAELRDPRGRSVVAAARAAQRTQTEAQLAAEQAKQSTTANQIAQLDVELQETAELDRLLAQNAAALRQFAPAYQAVLSNRQVAASLSRYTGELAEIATTLDAERLRDASLQSESRAASNEFDLANYQQVLLQERKLREDLGGLSAGMALMREAQARDEAQIESLRRDQASRRSLELKRQRLSRQDEVLDAVRSTIKQAGPFITSAIVRQVSESAAAIFGELMGDHSRVLAWGEDYGVTLSAGSAVRAFRQLSGGEQMSAALAVRLALVREMSSVNVAFFDEPTANLDAARREALAQQIMTVRGFNQLFVISHDDTFEQATQNLIRVARNGNTTVVGDAAG